MRVKKLENVLEKEKNFAVLIDGLFQKEVDIDTLMAQFGQYEVKAIFSGHFTEERCGRPIEIRPVLCLNLKGVDYEQCEKAESEG